MRTVLDYSDWRPPGGGAQLRARGVVGVMRYIAPSSWRWSKALTVPELTDLRANGLEVGFNFEKTARDWESGYGGGRQNGADAAYAMRELGMLPLGGTIHPSYDTDITPSQFGVATDYQRGFIAGAGGAYAIEGYCEGALMEHFASLGILHRGWMTESTGYYGNAAPTAHTALRQHFGLNVVGLPGSYDVNEVLQLDWGQYPPPTSAPVPAPAPSNEEEDVLFEQPKRTKDRYRRAVAKLDTAAKVLVLYNGASVMNDQAVPAWGVRLWKVPTDHDVIGALATDKGIEIIDVLGRGYEAIWS